MHCSGTKTTIIEKGTSAYMAPEIEKDKKYNLKRDIWYMLATFTTAVDDNFCS